MLNINCAGVNININLIYIINHNIIWLMIVLLMYKNDKVSCIIW